MSTKNQQAVEIMREYINEERQNVQTYAQSEDTLEIARELDRVLDNMERRCRIIESQ